MKMSHTIRKIKDPEKISLSLFSFSISLPPPLPSMLFQNEIGLIVYLTLSSLADQQFTIFSKSNYGRSSTSTFSIFNHTRVFAFHNGHTRVGSTQINTNNGSIDTRTVRSRESRENTSL